MDIAFLKEKLQKKRANKSAEIKLLKNYLDSKLKSNDWHGVKDAASDIRNCEAYCEALEWALKTITPAPRSLEKIPTRGGVDFGPEYNPGNGGRILPRKI